LPVDDGGFSGLSIQKRQARTKGVRPEAAIDKWAIAQRIGRDAFGEFNAEGVSMRLNDGDFKDLISYLRSLRQYLTTSEVAKIVRYHPETIYVKIKTENFPHHRRGGRLIFDPIEIAEWLELRRGNL
jgi:predicted DNA-binding transcriptional regulator AlpA